MSLQGVGELLGALGEAHGASEGAVDGAFAALVKTHPGAEAGARARIRVNADGYPVQVVLRLDGGEGGYGFIFDPSDGGDSRQTRRRRAVALVRATSSALNLPPPEAFERLILPIVRGREASALEAIQSAVWIAVAAAGTKSRLKLYISLDGLAERDRWRRFGELLSALKDREALAAFCSASHSVTCESTPVAIGVDFDGTNAPARLKLYVANKPCGPGWLRRWYALSKSANAYDAFLEFQKICGLGGYARYHESSFFVSADFGGQAGRTRIKTDIPVCRWLGEDDHARALLDSIVRTFGLNEPDYPVGLKALSCRAPPEATSGVAAEVASPRTSRMRRARATLQLIGLGGGDDAAPYVNAYLRPVVNGASGPF